MPRVAFLFPGQGAQSVGMAKELCEKLPAARALFEKASAILGYDLLAVCANGPSDRLNATDVSQPAIYVASLSALESLKGSEPELPGTVEATAGLSLGEYTALTFAGSLDVEDGIRVVQARGQAMQAAAEVKPSGMVSVLGLGLPEVEEICKSASGSGLIRIANLLCPGNIAVSGEVPALEAVERLAEEKGARSVRLAVAGAFHTPLMQSAVDRLAEALKTVNLKAPRIPVWSNVDAKPHTDPEEIRGLLVRQVVSPVLWEETIRQLLAQGTERFYEIGPGRVLAGLLKRVHRKAEIVNETA